MHGSELSGREKSIYDLLCDKESKAVFDTRRFFAMTQDESHFADVFVNRKQLGEVLHQLGNKPYAMWGGGYSGQLFIRYFYLKGISDNCVGIWDINPQLHGKTCLYTDHKTTPPDFEKLSSIDYILLTVISDKAANSITESLTANGFPADKIIAVEPFGKALGRLTYEEFTQYFEKDIITPSLSENEIFVDVGCCNFITSERFIDLAPSVKRIYAFEPDLENMQLVLQAVASRGWYVYSITKLFNVALWFSDTVLDFFVDTANKGASRVVPDNSNTTVTARKLDSIIAPEDKVTFIKMDIEGSELEALKGSAEIIKRDKPKLAISIYHKPTDYVDIAEYICSLVPEYKLYMRQYTPLQWETVLYCVL